MWSQPEQRSTCPPSAAVRHCSMADMTFSCPRLRCAVARHAGPWLRKTSATSSMRRYSARLLGGQAVQRTGDLVQQVGGHLDVERSVLDLYVSEQHLDHADVHLLLEQVC